MTTLEILVVTVVSLSLQAERERELRERERRLKEERQRMEQERRANEQQQRWLREESARMAQAKEEAERRDQEKRQREEKEKQQEEEMRAKQEHEQKMERKREQEKEREEKEKQLQGPGVGCLGKRLSYQNAPGGYDSKRASLSSDSYMSLGSSNSIFKQLDQQVRTFQGGGGGGANGGNGGLVSRKDLTHTTPGITSAATQALDIVQKSVPISPVQSSGGTGSSSSSSALQAQINQLAAATALANSGRLGGVVDYRREGGVRGGGGLSGPPNCQSMVSGGQIGGLVEKRLPRGGGVMGGGGLGKMPPEDHRYNRRFGDGRGRGSGRRARGRRGGGGYRGYNGRI